MSRRIFYSEAATGYLNNVFVPDSFFVQLFSRTFPRALRRSQAHLSRDSNCCVFEEVKFLDNFRSKGQTNQTYYYPDSFWRGLSRNRRPVYVYWAKGHQHKLVRLFIVDNLETAVLVNHSSFLKKVRNYRKTKSIPLCRCRSQDSDQSTIRLVQLVGGIVHRLLHPKTAFSKSKKQILSKI